MKILVVDDTLKQRDAAKKAFVGHNLTVVSTAQEARELLEEKFDNEKFLKLQKEAGFPEDYRSWEEKDEEKKALYNKLSNECYVYPNFDVVLTDLLMPGEKNGLGPQGSQFINEPTPYGFGIALLAIKNKVSKVAIVSMGDHHSHPILWFCDAISGTVFPGFKIFTHIAMSKEEFPDIENPWEIKDWARALKNLLEK